MARSGWRSVRRLNKAGTAVHEDDAERAVRAALRVSEAFARQSSSRRIGTRGAVGCPGRWELRICERLPGRPCVRGRILSSTTRSSSRARSCDGVAEAHLDLSLGGFPGSSEAAPRHGTRSGEDGRTVTVFLI
jgi:hypothetical protein